MREPALPVPEVCAVIDAALPRPRIGVVTLMLPPAPVPLVLADIRPPVVSDKSFAMCRSTVPAFPDRFRVQLEVSECVATTIVHLEVVPAVVQRDSAVVDRARPTAVGSAAI